MCDIVDNNNINIDIEDKICMICTDSIQNLLICKNDKCSVYICDTCIEKIGSDKCPYCRVSNSFEIYNSNNRINNTFEINNNRLNNFNINNIFLNFLRIDYICEILIKLIFCIIKFIFTILFLFCSYTIIFYICIMLTKSNCFLCYLFSILFSIIYTISVILFICNIIPKKIFIICIFNFFIISFINSLSLTKFCILNPIYFFFIIVFSILIDINIVYFINLRN